MWRARFMATIIIYLLVHETGLEDVLHLFLLRLFQQYDCHFVIKLYDRIQKFIRPRRHPVTSLTGDLRAASPIKKKKSHTLNCLRSYLALLK